MKKRILIVDDQGYQYQFLLGKIKREKDQCREEELTRFCINSF